MNRLADYLYVLARYIDAIQADKVEKSENTQVSGDKRRDPWQKIRELSQAKL